MAETATDFLGQTYAVADYVVYATTSGRSPVLKLGKVHRIESFPTTRYDLELHERVPAVGYKVGVEWITSGPGWTSPAEPLSSGRPRLSYPNSDNIVKVNGGLAHLRLVNEKLT